MTAKLIVPAAEYNRLEDVGRIQELKVAVAKQLGVKLLEAGVFTETLKYESHGAHGAPPTIEITLEFKH